jgi:site-specific DNA-methyltransferase (adenine-specific)
MKITENTEITNEDNMLLMARYPDNYFDLAIVDPPYGIGESKNNDFGKKIKNSATKKTNYKKKDWDSEVPNKDYFNELIRVSKNQIIWGVNNFYFNFSSGRIFWDKDVPKEFYSSSKGEIAFKSFNKSIDLVKITWNGMIQQDMKNKETRIHPTQKPVALYKWLLEKYAKPNDKILDTHLGSGSIAIACHEYNFELTACELDKEYYDAAVKRITNHVGQTKLF